MRGLILGDKDKPPMVLMHGFGSSGACHFNAFQYLCEYFTVYTVDWIGLGASDRPENFRFDFSPEETLNYVIDHFEKWREAMNLTDYYLVGHSYGGYFSGQVAVKYQEHIKKLLLLSPIGVAYNSPEQLAVYDNLNTLKQGKDYTTPPQLFRDIG